MAKLTVVLPAAGKGTRLNLPYSKEILRLDENNALIDNCFNLFKDYSRKHVEFVIVINEYKTDIIQYLSKYKDKYNISFIFQDPVEKEYTGAIKSAYGLFGEHNLVLLPDTLMTLKNNEDLFHLVNNALHETGFTFLYKEENNAEVLKTKGALFVNDTGHVLKYEDKPTRDIDEYNAFWCCFAFRKRTFFQCINFMEKSTLKQSVNEDEIKNTPIYNSKGIKILDYIDLGTWDEIRRFLSAYEKNNN